jgi:diguanylate cyclase (GGDEF)-like protein
MKSTWVRTVISLVIFLLFSATIIYVVVDGFETGRAGLREFYQTQLELLAQSAQSIGFSRRGDQQLQFLVESVTKKELKIVYAFIKRGNSPVIHTFDGKFPDELQQIVEAPDQEVSWQVVSIGEGRFYDFSKNYSHTSSSSIHIGVPIEVIDLPSGRNSIIPLILFGIGAVLIVAAILFVLWRGNSAPKVNDRPKRAKKTMEFDWPTLFVNAPSALVLYEAESGIIQQANNYFLNLVGRNKSRVLGKNINSFLVGSDDESVPLSLVDDMNEENTVYLKTSKGEVQALYAEAQKLYLDNTLCQLVAAFNISEIIQEKAHLRSERNEQSSRATTDQLTRLFNRQGITSHAEAELNRAERGAPLSLLLLDIDKFKSINDTYGHDAGDRVLKQMADILTTTKRPYDWAGRWGGEEFLILLPNTDIHQAEMAAERFRDKVASSVFHVSRGMDKKVTISIGVASTEDRSTGSLTLSNLVKAADEALYEAKRSGRNRSYLNIKGNLQQGKAS